MTAEPGDVTIATYQARAHLYRADELERPRASAVIAFLDRVGQMTGGGLILELGSGTGRDAAYLEAKGIVVVRSDATPAFVEILRDGGHDARVLDARRDELGGPYDGILAMATLLHLTRTEFQDLLLRARQAVAPGGFLAFTVKEGDGEGWSEAKLGLPRYFVYWREATLREALQASGWLVLSVDQVMGRIEPWLFLLARRLD